MKKTRRIRSEPRMIDNNQEPVTPLVSAEIEGLFGRYNFEPIRFLDQRRATPNLTFLYGDNGVGKTTLLRLIYATLSPERNSGHRGFLARTKFKNFQLKFADGQCLRAYRPEATVGAYTFELSGPRFNWSLKLQPGADFRVGTDLNPKLIGLPNILAKIAPALVFVNDHRTIRSTFDEEDVRFFSPDEVPRRVIYAGGNQVRPMDVDELINAGLERLLERTNSFLIELALQGNTEGNVGAGQIYLDIARAVVESESKDNQAAINKEFRSKLEYITNQLGPYSKYGLIEGQNVDQIRDMFEAADANQRRRIGSVLLPYLASLEKRIQSNMYLKDMVVAFDENVNRFLHRKSMVYRLRDNIKFLDDGGVRISSEDLSSGERHLLYLCCSALLSRGAPALILVDEPELSLNYKWQRLLVDALLEIAGSGSQFVMATHSFEIISKHRDSSVNLEPLK